MEKVLGIGGLFFRSSSPERLAKWYSDHLGVDPVAQDYATPHWRQQEGETVFTPFSDDTDYFGQPSKQWMVNFRVRDLDAMVAQLRAADIAVTVHPDILPVGRFARLYDPEGNPIELWEPSDPAGR
jgi:glyoxylase I family protein